MTRTLPNIFHQQNNTKTKKLLLDYFNEDPQHDLYSGRRFNYLGGQSTPSEITADDLLALSTLSVPTPGSAAVELMEDQELRSQIHGILGELPENICCTTEEGRALLTRKDSRLAELFHLIKGVRGFGNVRASKLLARKRPRLVPIYDSVIRNALGVRGVNDHWQFMVDIFQDETLLGRLKKLRDDLEMSADEISLLRIFDIVVWMDGR